LILEGFYKPYMKKERRVRNIFSTFLDRRPFIERIN
jgi:hypothetical protein